MKSQEFAKNEDIYKEWDKSWSKAGDNMTLAGKLITRGKQKAISKLLKDKDVSSAIDVGCGLGYTLKTLRDLGYDVKGIDVSKTAVDICRAKGLPAYQEKVEDEQGKYDLVFSDGLIEHFPDFHPYVKKLVQISRRYVIIAQTDHDTFVVKVLQFLEKIFRSDNVKELDYKIKDFIEVFEENDCRLLVMEPVFFNGFKVLLFKKEEELP